MLCDLKSGDNRQTRLPTADCVCSPDYFHQTRNETAAYGDEDSLKEAMWRPSITPSLPPGPGLITIAPISLGCLAKGDGGVINTCIDFCVPTCCQQTLISPNNCTALVLSKAFVGSPPPKCHNRFWLTLSFLCSVTDPFCVLSGVLREGLFDVHGHVVARFHTVMMKSRFPGVGDHDGTCDF